MPTSRNHAQTAAQPGSRAHQGVVLLTHGYGGSRRLLHRLRRRLSMSGRKTVTWGYFSLLGDIETKSELLRHEICTLEEDPSVGYIDLVVHSMGSILTRVAIEKYEFSKLRRIVMLCPPNRGSNFQLRWPDAVCQVRPAKLLSRSPPVTRMWETGLFEAVPETHGR